MVGDVNIFLNGTSGDPDFEAEAEIMIAGESSVQRNIYVPPLLLAPAVRRIRTDDGLCNFSLLRARLSPKGICQPCSATYVFLRHRT